MFRHVTHERITDKKMQKDENYVFLTSAPIPKVIGTMAVPTIISMLVTSLYNMADTYFVGKINTQATAAVGIVFSVMFVVQAFAFFFGNGAGTYIARELGAERKQNAERMASTALAYALFFAAMIVVLGLLFLHPLSILLGSTPTILPYTKDYLGISLLGTPFIMGTLCMNNQMRYQGYARYSMYGVVVGAVVNCVLDPVLIFTCGMGVSGAAWASVAGQMIGFSVMYRMSLHPHIIHYHWQNVTFRGSLVREIIAGGTPSLLRQGLASLSTIALNVGAGGFGDAAIAGMSIVNRLTMFIFSMVVGLGQGYQPMCGFCYGARLYERVKGGFWFCVKVSAVFLVCMAVLLSFFSSEVITLFRDDIHVVNVGAAALRYQLLTVIFSAIIIPANMVTQTCRMPIRANILAAARQGLFFVPLILVLPHHFGLLGVEISQPVSDVVTLLVTLPLVYLSLREMPSSNAN